MSDDTLGPNGASGATTALAATLPGGPAQAEAALSVGSRVGRYLLLSRLGAGGMGVVYAAYDPELDRKIALKVLRVGGLSSDTASQGRLMREAQAMARVSH